MDSKQNEEGVEIPKRLLEFLKKNKQKKASNRTDQDQVGSGKRTVVVIQGPC